MSWQKYLAVLLGSHAEATATVLGIFLGGLSAGYALFGGLSRELARRSIGSGYPTPVLLAYGLVEAGIGAWALLFPWLFEGVQRISLHLPQGAGAMTFALDVGLTVLLIGPPTVLMGGTIPLLTQGLARNLEDATRFHSLVYAFNTAGAFVGALAAGFLLIPALGLNGCVIAMGFVNLFAGAVFALLGRGRAAEGVGLARLQPRTDTPPRFAVYASVALLAGFAMMTLQTVLNRLAALSLGASHFTFAMIVAVFVLAIALGSLVVSLLRHIRPAYLVISQWLMVSILVGAYPWIQFAPYWAYRLRIAAGLENFGGFYGLLFLWGLALLVLPLGISGAMLPLLFHNLRNQVGDLGAVAGKLYAWNTVGSLLGALLGGYLLLFWLDLHHIYRLAVAALILGAALLAPQVLPGSRVWSGALALILMVGLAASPEWLPRNLTVGLFRRPDLTRPHANLSPSEFIKAEYSGATVVFHEDDPSVTVSVVRDPPGPHSGIAIVNNGKSDSMLPGDRLTTGLLGLLPAMLAEDPRHAFVIGYGTGHTVGALAALESMEEVVVAELSSGVVNAAPLFETFNLHALASPKTRMIRSDAYRALLRSEGSYDVIVSEPPNVWVAGVEMLFSREFLQAARRRLTPHGVYAQWFHLYEMNDATTALVLRTYLEAFESVAIWNTLAQDLVILGFNDDRTEIDLIDLQARFEQFDYLRVLRSIGVRSFATLLSHERLPIGVLPEFDLGDEVHTLLHPILSHRAARALFDVSYGSLPDATQRRVAEIAGEGSVVRRHLADLTEAEQKDALADIAAQHCKLKHNACIAALARWRRVAPGSKRLAGVLRRVLSTEPGKKQFWISLGRAERLHESKWTGPSDVSYEQAENLLIIFKRFYSHGIPFDTRALQGAWERCADPRCAAKLDAVRRLGVAKKS